MSDTTASQPLDDVKTPEQRLQAAIEFKDKGNELVREQKLADALLAYSAAIDLVPTNELFWSNRSMVYYQLGDGVNALADAERCIEINRNWGRGYSRKVNALQILGRHEDIIDTCKQGLAVERSDALLKNLSIACLERLEGKFWGTTSEAQGSYEQELEFIKERSVLKVRFFGQEIVCTYRIDPTRSPMTMVIEMPQQPPIVHIFRFSEQGLDLCSPSLPSGAIPTAFEGDGFIALKRGSQPQEPEDPTLKELPLHEKLALFVEEAIKIVPNRIEDNQPDAFLQIIHFQKNFYRLRNSFGQEADSMTKLLQGDYPPDVSPALVRRINVLREKMREAHLYEDPSGTEGDEDSSTPPEPVSPPRPTQETKQQSQPTISSSAPPPPVTTSVTKGTKSSGFSFAAKVVCGLVIVGGVATCVVSYFGSKSSNETKKQ